MGSLIRENEAVMGTRSDSSLLVWLVMGILAIVALCSMFFVINHRSTVSGLSNTGEIVIGADGFSPATLRIKKGSVVTWNNRGLDQHELAADQSELGLGNGQLLEIGDSYTYRFTNAGTYTYYDADNPNAFKGTVIVE